MTEAKLLKRLVQVVAVNVTFRSSQMAVGLFFVGTVSARIPIRTPVEDEINPQIDAEALIVLCMTRFAIIVEINAGYLLCLGKARKRYAVNVSRKKVETQEELITLRALHSLMPSMQNWIEY